MPILIRRHVVAVMILLTALFAGPQAMAERTLDLSSPNNFYPNKNVPFTVRGVDAARLRVWSVAQRPDGPARGKQVYDGARKRRADDYSIEFYVPLLQPGVYVAEAQNGLLLQTTSLRVTNIGLVTKRAPRELLVYAVRKTDNLPFPNVKLKISDSGTYNYEKKTWVRKPLPVKTVLTGKDGVARLFGLPSDGTINITATEGASYSTTVASTPDSSDDANKILFYTERPVYRPGQKVFYKGIVRRDLGLSGVREKGNIYAPVANQTIQIEITDAANNRIKLQQLKTNSIGSFTGSLELSTEAPIGRYSVEIKVLRAQQNQSSEAFYGRFAVQAYRKPEYEAFATPILPRGKPWAVQGEPFQVRINARYFYGAPVADATVKYSGDASGEAKLDDRGEAIITVENPRGTTQEDLNRTVQFQVVDGANRIVQVNIAVPAPWAEIKPELVADRYAYNLQDVAKFTVYTHDPAGRPVSGRVRLKLFYYRTNRIRHPESLRVEERTTKVAFFNGIVRTNAKGQGKAQVKLGRAGYIECEVSAADSKNRVSSYESDMWALSSREDNYYGYDFPNLKIELDRDEYRPGENVRALVTTNYPGTTALVTLESDRIFWYRVIRLTSRAMPIDFKLPFEAAPGAHLTIGLPSGGANWQKDTVYVPAQDPLKKLNIGVFAQKTEYRPGELANYTIVTKDGAGKPTGAEVSLSFVDKAIYSLATDETPEPFKFFYGERPLRVVTQHSLPREAQGGSYQRIEKPVAVRERFEDTAYWNPFVQTNADGRATLKFPLPDNLTTWRATARGITADTRAGVGYQETLVTKPLLVRLTLPRFYVENDRAQAIVVVSNNSKQDQNVRVSLRSTEAQLASVGAEERGAQTGVLPAGKAATFRWNVSLAEMPKSGFAVFTAVARTGDATMPDSLNAGTAFDDRTDAMKLSVPVIPRSVRVERTAAGHLVRTGAEATLKLAQPANAIPGTSRLDIQFAPSLAGPMLAALPELQGYPYGCTEQTLSRFVPTVVAARALRKLKKPLPPEMNELPKMVQKGLDTLNGYQHDDGGWGWWREDDTDPFLTGYTVYGLALAQEAGFTVERRVLIRGLNSIQRMFQEDYIIRKQQGEIPGDTHDGRTIGPDVRAWMMLGYTTAIAAANITSNELSETQDYPRAVFNQREKLSNYSLAALATAYARATDITPPKGKAKSLAANADSALKTLIALLESRVKNETIKSGSAVYWPSLADDGGWRDSDIETTALAVQALVRGKPTSPLIVPALRWLINQRSGSLWDSTKDSAQAVIALADYLQLSPELEPDETVRVLVNGVEKASVRFTAEDIAKADRTIRMDNLTGDATITVQRTGRGAVYFAARLTAHTRDGLDTTEDNGFRIQRRYSVLRDKKWVESTVIPNGELVRVELQITTAQKREYVLIEDPLPSGFEVREEDTNRAWPGDSDDEPSTSRHAPWIRLQPTRLEVRDDRVAIFVSSLWSWTFHKAPYTYVYRYILRPEQTGTRTALPTRAELMYRPDINGRSTQNVLEVK
jgi:uncharacterized protein YfaS (alpha-2-macroglobulin family)